MDCSNIQKYDAHIKRDIKNKLNDWHYLMLIKFNNYGTRGLNEPRCLFHLFCRTTWHIFEPLRVYEPGFNMDKYGMHGISI